MLNSNAIEAPDQTTAFVQETAIILASVFQLNETHTWLWHLGNGDEWSPQEVLENWVWFHVNNVDASMAESLFQVLYLKFESLYFEREGRS